MIEKGDKGLQRSGISKSFKLDLYGIKTISKGLIKRLLSKISLGTRGI